MLYPAKGLICHGCGKTGYFQRCFRSTKKEPSILSAVVVANTNLVYHLMVRVAVNPSGESSLLIFTIVDTGAQDCVTQCKMLPTLCLKPSQLKRHKGLMDIADLLLSYLGSTKCIIELGDEFQSRKFTFYLQQRTSSCHYALVMKREYCQGICLILPVVAVTEEEFLSPLQDFCL